jgi:ferric-dicitrate binding protein FerR (iron transport regulator)
MTTINDLILKYLNDQLTPEEKNTFNQWIKDNPVRSKKLEEYKAIWEKTKNYPIDFNPDAILALAEVHKNAGIKLIQKSTSRFTPILKIASVVAIIISIIGLTYYTHLKSNNKYIVMYSGKNEIREIVLKDSSHVWLNENSTLLVPSVFKTPQRKVILRGEAFFEIKRNKTKPFIVCTGNTFTEVLGTSFNIKMDTLTGNVSVIVNSGKVAFYSIAGKSKKSILYPTNQGVFIESTNQIQCSSNMHSNFLAWKTGILTFYSTPLNEVCFELSNHFKKSIKATTDVANKSLTGTFRNQTLESILKTIELTLDVKVNMSGEKIIIYK